MSDEQNKGKKVGLLRKGFDKGVGKIEKLFDVSSGNKWEPRVQSEHTKKNTDRKKGTDKKSHKNPLKRGCNKADLNAPGEEETHPVPDKPECPSRKIDLQDLEQQAILQVSGMTGMVELLARMCAAADLENWPTFVFLASSYQTKAARLGEILSLCGEDQKLFSDHALYLRLLKISNLLKEQGIENDTEYTPDRFPAEKLKPCAAAISQNWRKEEETKDET